MTGVVPVFSPQNYVNQRRFYAAAWASRLFSCHKCLSDLGDCAALLIGKVQSLQKRLITVRHRLWRRRCAVTVRSDRLVIMQIDPWLLRNRSCWRLDKTDQVHARVTPLWGSMLHLTVISLIWEEVTESVMSAKSKLLSHGCFTWIGFRIRAGSQRSKWLLHKWF